MSVRNRGLAVWMAAALSLAAAWAQAQDKPTQDKTVLTTDRERISYMVGADVGRTIVNAGPDMDMAAFERAIRNAFAGGKPLLSDEESKAIYIAMTQRTAERAGRPIPGLPPGAKPPAVARDKVGLMIGTDVGRSLAPIQQDLDMPVFLQAVRTLMTSSKPLLSEEEMDRIRADYVKRRDAAESARDQMSFADRARMNAEEGTRFLARNRTETGVITTRSGLQYRVLRQGSGLRPRHGDRVRVHYQGALLDGKVFDTTYGGQPTEFALNQVIAGWTEGLMLMPVGAKYRFWIPSSIAYGEKGQPPNIGPNATLVFDVELLGIP
jgi:FKBP-type peptidyl-prolyl cis-trans isomerase FkpA